MCVRCLSHFKSLIVICCQNKKNKNDYQHITIIHEYNFKNNYDKNKISIII